MELNSAILARHSTRAFTNRQLTRGEITELLTAAIKAPTACNMQSWHFYVVTDAEQRAKFNNICAAWVSTAPVVFIICTDSDEIEGRFGSERGRKFALQDTSYATENILLKATDMGLGGCIIGAYDQDACVREFSIPEKHHVVALLPIGEPASPVPPRERKPLGDVVTFIGGEPLGEVSAPDEAKQLIMRRVSYPNAVFDDVNLADSSFNNINMSGVRFSDINMRGTSFGGMTFEGAHFGCIEMQHARFENVDFTGAEFINCDFSDVKFDGCDLTAGK